ncbi:MAG: hypothetical protein EOO70_06850, partial [Myxococcaceae bacterium]
DAGHELEEETGMWLTLDGFHMGVGGDDSPLQRTACRSSPPTHACSPPLPRPWVPAPAASCTSSLRCPVQPAR